MGKLFGLLGHPVGHSMSPVMHNDMFTLLGLNHHYQAFDVEPDKLKTAVDGIKALGISGFNITIPHKVDIMEQLDHIDDEAKEIGAVNTVVNDKGKLIGYNTDGRGFVTSLKQAAGEDLSKQSILIVGAGGAARAIFISLVNMGNTKVDIANRTLEKAEQLIQATTKVTKSKAITIIEAEKCLDQYDIIINTTSVGMSPNIDQIPISLELLKPGTVLADIIYNPLETKWLRIGKEKGAITQNGVGMFVGQGALAFEKWTGQTPDLKRMEQVVIQQLS